MQVVELSVENFMGVKAIAIEPGDRSTVVIGGENGQGKTSLLDAIECAIRGKAFHPDQPVRRGEEQAEIKLDLGDLKIRRRFKPNGESVIDVTNADGFKPTKPQAMLDALAGAISFDPLDFARMDPKKRLALVRDLSGIDTSELEAERVNVFAARTDVNRDVKRLDGELASLPPINGEVPDERVSVSATLTELQLAQQKNRARMELKDHMGEALHEEDQATKKLADLRDEITRVQQIQEDAAARAKEYQHAYSEMEEIDCDPLHAAINGAESVNAEIDANERWMKCSASLEAVRADSKSKSERLSEIDEERSKMIASAKLPVPGLSFSDEDGVTLDGIPFEQRSSAEKLEASIRIGMELNPKLRVMLVRDGCLLDKTHMALVADYAEKGGYQFWVERVGTNDAGAIVIEDGEVRA